MKYGNLKLKHMLAILISGSLGMLVFIQVMYYVQFSALTRERVESYSAGIISQVNGQFDLYIQNIRSSAEQISFNRHVQEFLTTKNPERKYVELSPFILDFLQYVKSSNHNIQDILLTNANGEIITSVDEYEFDMVARLEQEYQFTQQKSALFTAAVENNGAWYYAYLFPVISASNRVELFECLGYCILISKTDGLENLVLDISLAPDSHFFITDSKDRVVASNKREDIGSFFEQELFHQRNSVEDMMMQEKAVGDIGWTIHSYVSRKSLTSDMRPILANGLIIGIAATVCLFFLGFIFLHGINRSITQLVKFMKEIENITDIRGWIDLEGSGEIGVIAQGVNRMLDKIDEMTHKVVRTQAELYDAEIGRKQMELSMLQSQINPHFLYNTMNCISSIGLAYQVPEIVTIASAVSKVFRYGIKGADMVMASEELDCVQEYLKIMGIRYHDKFTYTVEMEEGVEKQRIPKMLLQPIVENALYHGIERKSGKGVLKIRGCFEESGLLFSVEDTGKGMDADTLESLREQLVIAERPSDGNLDREGKKGIGLANIHSRLRLLYGKPYGITVDSRENQGTRVEIRIPKRGA